MVISPLVSLFLLPDFRKHLAGSDFVSQLVSVNNWSMFRVSVCEGKNENSHFMDVFETLDTGLHTADDILLNLFHRPVIPTEKESRLEEVPKSYN